MKKKFEVGGKEYVAGYIAKKLMDKFPELAMTSFDKNKDNEFWVRKLSEGGLVEPSSLWMSYFNKFEEYFEVFHPNNGICKDSGIVKRFSSFLRTNYPCVPEKVVNFYAKVRTMIRISHINKKAEDRKFLVQEQIRNQKSGFTGSNQNVRMSSNATESHDQEEHDEIQDLEGLNLVEQFLNVLDNENVGSSI